LQGFTHSLPVPGVTVGGASSDRTSWWRSSFHPEGRCTHTWSVVKAVAIALHDADRAVRVAVHLRGAASATAGFGSACAIAALARVRPFASVQLASSSAA
jgi:hypothetical protein